MVDFVCYGQGDARTFDLYDFANGTAVYSEQTSESFRIDYVDDGVSKTTYIYGFGFEYFPPGTPNGFAGAPSTGTTTSATNYIGDTLNATVTGLNISTPQAYEYIQWNDPQRVSADVFKGNDTITGSVFDDYLDGWAGADTFRGDAGSDTYLFDNVGDRAFEDADSGIDTIVASLTQTLGINIENLTLTGSANLNGTGNELDNILIGNTGRNTLTGGLGSDTLNGSGGTDRLVGGDGNDTYVIDAAGATIVEVSTGGIDTVRASISVTLATNVENLILTGPGGNGTGNALANIITGNSGNNALNGLAGADTMTGGAGNDTYYVDNVGDQVVEASGQGNDRVFASINYTLAENVERLELASVSNIAGTGNALANTIVGGGGANTLTGLGGKDTLTGGASRDTFVFTSLSDSTVATAGRDTITDFNQSETDRLDLRLIDANANLEGDQAFSLIGTSAFSRSAGQLRYEASGSDTLVSGDVDGNGAADFAILLTGSFTLARGDFLL